MKSRAPALFWHNIGPRKTRSFANKMPGRDIDSFTRNWWACLQSKGFVAAGFGNVPGGKGEKLLKRYNAGDTIIAYCSGHGALGWGIVERPDYKWIGGDRDECPGEGFWLHRLHGVKWHDCRSLENAVPAAHLREVFEIKFPRQMREKIPSDRAQKLVEMLKKKS